MNNHKQLISFLIAIIGLTAAFFSITFAEINQNEDNLRNHEQLPAHAVAGEKFETIEKSLDEIKEILKNNHVEKGDT